MSKISKVYCVVVVKVDCINFYILLQVVKFVKEILLIKQDVIVEVVIWFGVDLCKVDQMVCGMVNLLYGIGKIVCVVVFVVGEKVDVVVVVGVDVVGSDDLIERIQGGWLEFDVVIVVLDQMVKVGCIVWVLGLCGLMFNLKIGIVIVDVVKVVVDIKGGKINFWVDKQVNLYFVIGKVLFDEKLLVENYGVVIDEVLWFKLFLLKGCYLKKIIVLMMMGLGILVDLFIICNFVGEQFFW